MKKTLIVIALLFVCCFALFALRTGSIMTFGYDAKIDWNSDNKMYMHTGPSIGMSSIWTYGSTSESMGYYNRLDLKLDLQYMSTDGTWYNYRPSKTSTFHLFEIGGFGFNLPVSYSARLMMGLGASLELDYYNSSSVTHFEELLGFGVSAEFILNLTDSFGLDVGAVATYVLWAYGGGHGPGYSYYGDLKGDKGFGGVSAKVALGFSF